MEIGHPIAWAQGGSFDIGETFVDSEAATGHAEEEVGLFFMDNSLGAEIELLTFLGIERNADAIDNAVTFFITEADAVAPAISVRGRVPSLLKLVEIGALGPGRADEFKLSVLDILDKDGKIGTFDFDFDTEGSGFTLEEQANIFADIVALIILKL